LPIAAEMASTPAPAGRGHRLGPLSRGTPRCPSIATISFPLQPGTWNNQTKRLLKKLGCGSAYTLERRIVKPGGLVARQHAQHQRDRRALDRRLTLRAGADQRTGLGSCDTVA
jgi:hypothetical protein